MELNSARAVRLKRNKNVYRNYVEKNAYQKKLQEEEVVKQLVVPEEEFSYDDEFKTFESDVVRTLKPQFVYDAAEAVRKEKLKASQERFEAINNRFWKQWAPTIVQKRKKKRKSLYNLDVMVCRNDEERALMRETSAMYQEAIRKAARDAIEFSSNVSPPSVLMMKLPEILHELRRIIENNESKDNYLFADTSQTSSIVNVKEWFTQLRPVPSSAPFRKQVSIKHIPSLTTQVVPTKSIIPSLTTQVFSKKSIIPSLTNQVVSKKRIIPPSLTTQVVSKKRIIPILTSQVVSKKSIIPSLTTQAVSKKSIIPSLTTQVVSKKSIIPSLTTQVVSKKSIIPSLTTQVASKKSIIPSLTTQVVSKKSIIPSLTTQVASKKSIIPSLTTQGVQSKSKSSRNVLTEGESIPETESSLDTKNDADVQEMSKESTTEVESTTDQQVPEVAVITRTQLLGSRNMRPYRKGFFEGHAISRKNSVAKQEDIELVRRLSVAAVESKTSELDLSKVDFWQEPILFYEKQPGIDYNKNFLTPNNSFEYRVFSSSQFGE